MDSKSHRDFLLVFFVASWFGGKVFVPRNVLSSLASSTVWSIRGGRSLPATRGCGDIEQHAQDRQAEASPGSAAEWVGREPHLVQRWLLVVVGGDFREATSSLHGRKRKCRCPQHKQVRQGQPLFLWTCVQKTSKKFGWDKGLRHYKRLSKPQKAVRLSKRLSAVIQNHNYLI